MLAVISLIFSLGFFFIAGHYQFACPPLVSCRFLCLRHSFHYAMFAGLDTLEAFFHYDAILFRDAVLAATIFAAGAMPVFGFFSWLFAIVAVSPVFICR